MVEELIVIHNKLDKYYELNQNILKPPLTLVYLIHIMEVSSSWLNCITVKDGDAELTKDSRRVVQSGDGYFFMSVNVLLSKVSSTSS